MTARAIKYGCANPDCGYSTVPTTMRKPYEICPLCGKSPFVANPPIPNRDGTGQAIVVTDPVTGKVKRRTVIRPHLQESFDRLEGEQCD